MKYYTITKGGDAKLRMEMVFDVDINDSDEMDDATETLMVIAEDIEPNGIIINDDDIDTLLFYIKKLKNE